MQFRTSGAARALAVASVAMAAWAVASEPAHAQSDAALTTDRPDFVEGSATVGNGRLQIETSVSAQSATVAGLRYSSVSTPTLLRYGFAERWEVRLATDGYVQETSHPLSLTQRGMADLSLGLKWHVLSAAAGTARPSVGILIHADVPSGSGIFAGQGVRPSLVLAGEWELPSGFFLGLMPGVVYDTGNQNARFVSGVLAAVLGRTWTENFSTFAELAGRAGRVAGFFLGHRPFHADLTPGRLRSNAIHTAIDTSPAYGDETGDQCAEQKR